MDDRVLLELGKRGYLELEEGVRRRKDRVVRLTEKGRLHALGGRDPEAWWSRPWDGKWRLVMFDIPEKDKSLRDKLRRYLTARHFGYLQNSVWVSPDPFEIEDGLFAGSEINVERLLTLTAVPGTGEKNSDIVAGAWDFEAINKNYLEHQSVLAACPDPGAWGAAREIPPLRRWIDAERAAWRAAVGSDPLLPRSLCPEGYAGEKAWKLRGKRLKSIARRLSGVSGIA